ncbi:curved DNA-binding protein, DnaJ homologue that functions as a co-chaperone of DnaK [Acidithiobacillus ferrivorans]|uniref:Curved DNA-binding protein, DnaJ homologue that functions as a co-chaperone of DnaK n=1 Tax=Acidithiobacillus ferrivorans TaxID=160808 RepID=A0A060UQL1_9PROT|nr:DnaJ C-terminal domain-containing protein [Acidithiobacillus ferrivorans]CDQ09078.1 DnaJ-class molecular chaperone cbpA [Acidithiobacillus ferrivorans]SMH66610.1 curved DNA-binding protein, DnaJ homologue that functions as a co-chaperone of DnaK [Acidithiobacillus ferrivorans]
MEYKDYYRILGVERSADADAIKASYRKMARKYHPDVSKEKDAEDRFKDLQEAYEVLKDPEKRAAYDQLGSNWRAGQDFRPPPGWGQQAGGGGADFGGGGFSDFFESMFRQQQGGGFRGSGGGGFRRQGEDSEATIQVSLEDAAHGAQREISLEVPTMGSDGRMRREARHLTVKIPKGIRAGQRLRMAGQGAPGMGGGPNGDLYLHIQFQPHPRFRVEGSDLYHDLHITPWEAALGASVEIPTLDGDVRMKIPAGSTSGQKLRLSQKGLPGSVGKMPGDLYAVIQIVVPKKISEPEKALWNQLAEISDFHPRR